MDSTGQTTRRAILGASAASLGIALADAAPLSARTPARRQVRYSLNTSTIDGQKLTIDQKIDIAARAGYDVIEPWMRELDAYVKAGGKLADLRKRITAEGLTVESAIGFAPWIVNDDAQRRAALEQAKRDMDKLAQIGGKRIAAPPVGAHREGNVSLDHVAERYRALLELGCEMGIVPQLELWGFSRVLSRVSELAYVAVEAAHRDACLLLDVYHIYKGGSGFTGLNMIPGRAVRVCHMNDYPADPPREKIQDADRVYPGEGVAPLKTMLRTFFTNGFEGTLSLELFNRDYWKQDPLAVAKRGLQAMRRSVETALAQ